MTARLRERLAWLAALVGAPALFVLLLLAIDREPVVDPALAVTSGLLWTGAGSPLDDAAAGTWQRVDVPHSGVPDVAGLHGAWLKLEPNAAQLAGDRLALAALHPTTTLDVYVDGALVGSGGPTTRPPAFHQFPLLFAFANPGHARGRGAHPEILVHSVREGVSTWIPEMLVGPVGPLDAAASARWWFVAGLPRISALLASSLALLAIGFSVLRKQDTTYAWFAGAVVFWLAHLVRDHVPTLPLDRPVWVATTNVALGAFVYCAIGFIHRFVGHDGRRLERAGAWLLVAGAVVLLARALVFRWEYRLEVTIPWVVLVNLGGVYLVWRLAVATWQQFDVDRLALLAASAATSGVGIRDFLYDFDLWPVGSSFWLGHALALVVLVFGTIVVRRFARAVDGSERLNEELAERVRAKTAELAAHHERLRHLEAEQSRRHEREKLMRRIHDGLGGQLVQGIAVASRSGDRSVLADIITACLRDLDSLAQPDAAAAPPLAALLGALCAQLAPRLAAAGIAFECRDLAAGGVRLSAAQAEDVLGIVQEAVTNALKHSGCRTITVHAGATARALDITVRDDGRGPAPGGTGHGLAGMRERAHRLGGTLALDGTATGTRVVVSLPLRNGIIPP